MKKLNCWEYFKCNRQPGGSNVDELGVCPAAVDTEYDGVHEGQCAGRYCWRVAGTLCKGRVQGAYAVKLNECLACDFFKKVQDEEGITFKM